MDKIVIPLVIGIIAIIIGLSFFAGYWEIPEIPKTQTPSVNVQKPDNFEGPFNEILALNKKEYKLGENIFIYVADIGLNDKGNILFITPNEIIIRNFPIDGSLKTEFNTYFTPDTSIFSGICTPEELVGTWIVYFDNLPYNPIEFEIINEFIPREEVNITVVC